MGSEVRRRGQRSCGISLPIGGGLSSAAPGRRPGSGPDCCRRGGGSGAHGLRPRALHPDRELRTRLEAWSGSAPGSCC